MSDIFHNLQQCRQCSPTMGKKFRFGISWINTGDHFKVHWFQTGHAKRGYENRLLGNDDPVPVNKSHTNKVRRLILAPYIKTYHHHTKLKELTNSNFPLLTAILESFATGRLQFGNSRLKEIDCSTQGPRQLQKIPTIKVDKLQLFQIHILKHANLLACR